MPAGAPIEIVDLAPRRFGAVRRRSTLDGSTDMATAAPVWPRILSRGVTFGLPVLVFHDAAGPELFEEPGVEIDLGFELFADLDDPIVTMATSPGGRAVRLDITARIWTSAPRTWLSATIARRTVSRHRVRWSKSTTGTTTRPAA